MLSIENRWNAHLCICEDNRPATLTDAQDFIDALFANGELIKEDKRSQLVRGQYGQERFVAKRYKTRKMRYILNGLRHGRGSLPAWNNIFLLRQLGIPTLEPVLLLEQRVFRLPRESFLVTREIQGEELRVFLDKNQGNLTNAQLEGLRQLLERFYQAKLIHGDMNEANIMMTAQGSIILDLDKLSKPASEQEFTELFHAERERFLRKLLPWPEAREQIAAIFPTLK